MGVHGLWDLLSPVGRRVSVETLAGKRLAIDASIWMVQFMKAMRDEQGEMVRNAHILGFFRRICKLLFLRTKPVFVFDGATPALKRRTVVARRRQRENAQAKIRKTAEKLLLNHLKSMRLKELANDLENQRKSNQNKGKKVITENADCSGTTAKANPSDTKVFDQEALDAMLAASIEAEESEGFVGEASTSGAGVLAEDEDEEDDEETLLPTLEGKIDPAVLASLPPSMQLDLLVQMRERLMAENRQKYQKVKKAPEKFSELQIEAYLKTVAFRREINEVQKVAGGRGVGGVQTSRIASEANREFIFSSSFTGDRQSLTSAGVETNSNTQSQTAIRKLSIGSLTFGSTTKSNGASESTINEPKKTFNEEVETYRDERGRVRVSKVRAMGIRMTRDLQRNLDLMKENEKNKLTESSKLSETSNRDQFSIFTKTNRESTPANGTSIDVSFDDIEKQFADSTKTNQESVSNNGISIEVSFDEDNEKQLADSDDDVFVQLVTPNDTLSEKQPVINLSDCEWEEGMPGEIKYYESDVEWEEGPSDNNPDLSSANELEQKETISKGDLLEEMDFQEAIRLSMDDVRCHKNIDPEECKDIASPRLSSECVLLNKSSVEEERVSLINELLENNSTEKAEIVISSNTISSTPTHISNSPDANQNEVKDQIVDHVSEPLEPKETSSSKSEFESDRQDDGDRLVINDLSDEQVEITKANLEEEMADLNKERVDLGDEQRRLERNAESVSGEMFSECQELLQMFGLPYIIAPMEAEAQCAFMELEKLVDGVVTDDSDVLLFGARSVYKNIFDDRKYVETYFMKDIETELGLTREKLIRMAMLLGSDYTEGISGIGIVNAVEVINAFPEEDGLRKFREWIESPDPSILGKVDSKDGSNARKRGSNASVDDLKQIFMDKHRNVSKNWHIPSTFPSDAVVSAYASPQVDKSTEPFSWGKPDLFVLRKLCFEKFGWGAQKADELLQPVLKEYNKHETQLRLEAFYTFNERFAKIRSKRISKAVKGLAGSKSSELMDHNEEIRKKAKHDEDKNEVEKSELSVQERHSKKMKRGKSVGRKSRRKKNNLELSGTSSDDENRSDYVEQVQAEHSHGARKSKRVKKSVISSYNEDSETDEPTTQDHQETLGNSMETGVSGDHGSRVDADVADVGKDEVEFSKEYLEMGGGFCLEEDEDDKEAGVSGCGPPTEGLGDAVALTSPDDATEVSAGGINEEDGVGVSYFSAMPNLRRKRKRV